MKLLQYLLAFVITASVVSCNKDDNPGGGGTNPTTAQTILNVSYGTDAAQKMDIYLPANRSTATTKVMILIHGGGWTTGDKNDFSTLQNGVVVTDTMRKRLPDYAIININYRLSTGTANIFPTQENDVKAALQFIFSKSADYVISDKYVLAGASAGAHLAMLQGFKYTTPVKVKAVISFFGPSDLTDMYNNPAGGNPILSIALASAIGVTPAQNAAIYTSSSPINFITSTSPATILLHGSADPAISPSQSQFVNTKMNVLGPTSQYVLYAGKGHGDWPIATYIDAFDKIQAFLAANVP